MSLVMSCWHVAGAAEGFTRAREEEAEVDDEQDDNDIDMSCVLRIARCMVFSRRDAGLAWRTASLRASSRVVISAAREAAAVTELADALVFILCFIHKQERVSIDILYAAQKSRNESRWNCRSKACASVSNNSYS